MTGAVYTYPDPATDEAFRPKSFELGLEPSVIVSSAPFASATRTIEVPGPVWVLSIGYSVDMALDRARVEAFWAKVRGQANMVRFHHLVRPVPRGTMRGTPTADAATVDAESVTINCTTGDTLLAGDMIGIGTNLLMVTADAAESGGEMTVSVAPPVKVAIEAATLVTWNKPSAIFLLTVPRVMVGYEGAARAMPFSVELAEV